jgi:DNA polymerase I-like protein with 3'-5' exonuclease and polymerase domains
MSSDDEGPTMIDIDYTEIEKRVLAHYGADEADYLKAKEEKDSRKKVKPIDLLAAMYGGVTRAERRAFKSRLLRLARQEARKRLREG